MERCASGGARPVQPPEITHPSGVHEHLSNGVIHLVEFKIYKRNGTCSMLLPPETLYHVSQDLHAHTQI
jgi:hypothetical protein